MNWANMVTCSRIALIPVVMLLYTSDFPWHHLWATAVFGLASFTDWLDGYLARRLNQASEFGAFLDPVADKLLVALILVLLVERYSSIWFVIPVALIIGREILISALREWMASRSQRDVVAVAFAGKLKTTVQMIAILILLFSDPDGFALFWISGYVFIYVAAVLSLYSMIQYFAAAWTHIGPGSSVQN